MLAVVGVRGRTKTAQGHVVKRGELVVGSGKGATGLAPGFAGYPCSTFVGTEQVAVMVGLKEKKTGLSIDEDAVGDESELRDSKRWERDMGSDCGQSKRCGWGLERVFVTLEVAVEGVGDSRTVLSLDEDGGRVVLVVKSHLRSLDQGGWH